MTNSFGTYRNTVVSVSGRLVDRGTGTDEETMTFGMSEVKMELEAFFEDAVWLFLFLIRLEISFCSGDEDVIEIGT